MERHGTQKSLLIILVSHEIRPHANDNPSNPYWACRLCDAKGQPEFFAAAATSSAADHLRNNIPFSFFMDPFFEQLVWQLDPHLSGQIPWSRQSMSRLLDDVYKSKRDQVKQELLDALTKIHLGFDLWTSPNRSLDIEMILADVYARCMRCYGHILNLAACAFLYGEDFEAFEAKSQVFNLLGRHKEDLRH
ncbi:hypothetical protein S40285_08648 [Stachybotrys chlorohalonatus IBT 40285]|uniref:Uncharacterized protein n=1 Tax=Stachybotrys chlorohalonatus (strain IBT 40285) TaxID=1283841 RepID=A0A084QTJ1_STAC4|nr:hypothetical protein S40285_08648 [Stachybotrys chlorohalonata IBT 40285]